MGSGGASPPAYPGLSQSEQDLLQKQGLTLDQFNNILSNENIGQTQNQDLLRQLSGLYSSSDVAATPDTTKFNEDILGLLSSKDVNAWPALKLSNDPTVKALLQKNPSLGNMSGSQAATYLRQNPQAAVAAGAATTVKGTAASKNYTLNQPAVDDLRKRVAAAQANQQQLTDLEQGIYKQGLTSLNSQLPQITELNQLSLDRQKRALEGTLPVSQGLLDQKTQDWMHLKESAARRGIVIDGEDPGAATSQSSAGNELVGQFNRTYGLLTDAERRGELSGGVPGQVYTPGPASSTPSYGQSLNFAQAPGSGSLLGAYGNLASLYGGATQPYAQANMASYQGLLNSYNQRQSNTASQYQLGGTVFGLLAGGGYRPSSGGTLPVPSTPYSGGNVY